MGYNDYEVMVDIETLSTKTNAAILTIGAIKFKRYMSVKPLDKMDTFYTRITLDSCKAIGLSTDKKTIQWWNKQSTEARDEIFSPDNRVSIQEGLQDFADWYPKDAIFWAHGITFDAVILENAFRKCNIEVPWNFWKLRDTRTLFDITHVTREPIHKDDEHNALCDCYRQVITLQNAFQKIRLE